MKVKELIEHLNTLDPESIVVVSGYEGGVSDVTELVKCKVRLNQNTSWYCICI